MKQVMMLSVVICCMIAGNACLAQDVTSQRTELVWRFVKDLRTDIPFGEIYRTYLEQGDSFANPTRKKVADDWTQSLHTMLTNIKLEDVEVYQYTDHPDSALVKRQAGDPAEDHPEYRPLRFLLNMDPAHSNLSVNFEDVYVVRLKDTGILTYVLFNEHDKMVTYGALQILNTVWLGKF